MPTTILRNGIDTFVQEATPTKNFMNSNRMWVGTMSGNTRVGYIFFSLPFAVGSKVNVISASLSFYSAVLFPGNETITIAPVSQAWSQSRITWDTRPTEYGDIYFTTKNNAPANTQWEIDCTSALQSAANGRKWFGFRIYASGTESKSIFSTQATTNLRPMLEITWSTAPEKPTKLIPEEGWFSVQYPTLQCDFTDTSGDRTMEAIQVQVDAAKDTVSPDWDSGTVLKDEPELVTDPAGQGYISMPAWSGVATGTSTWWRVRVRDGAGLWSPWSDWAYLRRHSKGALVIDSPAASPNNKVYEGTPPIDWTFTPPSGHTQRAYRVDVGIKNQTPSWSSGKITSSVSMVNVPPKIITDEGLTYYVRVWVWDTVNRENLPNDSAAVVVYREFTFDYDVTVAPATSFVATAVDPWPWVHLTWSRTSQPDLFQIYRDGKLIVSDVADRFNISGQPTNYQFTDKVVAPYVNHTYKVVAVVNSRSSASSPTIAAEPKAITAFLCDEDGTDGVFFWNYEPDLKVASRQEIVEFVGDRPPMIVSQPSGGMRGSISGIVSGIRTNMTSRQMLDRFKTLSKNPGETLRMTLIDQAFKCYIYNATWRPIKKNEDIIYHVSFEFIQVDY